MAYFFRMGVQSFRTPNSSPIFNQKQNLGDVSPRFYHFNVCLPNGPPACFKILMVNRGRSITLRMTSPVTYRPQ